MQRIHMHKPGWMHVHKPNWHDMGIRLEHLLHDPRFWSGLVLAALFAAMIITAILSKPMSSETTLPLYPAPFYPALP